MSRPLLLFLVLGVGCGGAPWRPSWQIPTRDSPEEAGGTAARQGGSGGMPSLTQLWTLREDARDAFYHAYDSYMRNGWPADELMPLSCAPREWNKRSRGTLDDCLGGFALTAVDALDTLAVLGDYGEFRRGVARVVAHVSFDRDVTVSVFETTIRVLGGLLSAHALAADEALGIMPDYNDELLGLAIDLGERLLPAFDTPTGIPYHRVNLRRGVLPSESPDTCTAAAGSLLIEFGTLSRYSGHAEFAAAARRAVLALWARRSGKDLVGADIDVVTGKWRSSITGIGAGVDSYYEYLLKAGVLFEDEELLSMFDKAYAAVNAESKFLGPHGGIHVQVDSTSGRASAVSGVVSALQAFWPALEVLAGDVAAAREVFRPLRAIWRRHRALPEAWDMDAGAPLSFARDAPLRPELLESACALFAATGAPEYVRFGASVLEALNAVSRVECGYAAVGNVATGHLDDRMDSYFLAETVKYLFLLFDAALLPEGHAVFYGGPAARAGRVPMEGHMFVGAAENRSALCEALVCGHVAAAAACCSAGDCAQDTTFACRVVLPLRGRAAADAAVGALPMARRLALRVRSARSAYAAAPLRSADYVMSTEGHLFALRGRGWEASPDVIWYGRSRVWRYEHPLESQDAWPAEGAARDAPLRTCAAVERHQDAAPAAGVAAGADSAAGSAAMASAATGSADALAAPAAAAAAPAVHAGARAPSSDGGGAGRSGSSGDSGVFAAAARDSTQPAAPSDVSSGTRRWHPRALWAAEMGMGGAFGRVLVACRGDGLGCAAADAVPFALLDVLMADGTLGVVDVAPAMFGPPIGGPQCNAVFALVVAQPPDACSELLSADGPDDARGAIVLAFRGGCSFVAKARWIEAAGGRAMVVVDIGAARDGGGGGGGVGPDGAPLLTVMEDDGSGGDVHIPCGLVGPGAATSLLGRVAAGAGAGKLHLGAGGGRVMEVLRGDEAAARGVGGVIAEAARGGGAGVLQGGQ